MNLTLIVSDNCKACERARKTINNIKLIYPQIITDIVNINSLNDRKISITPALLINNQLFSYGDIDESRLTAKISKAADSDLILKRSRIINNQF